MNNLALSYYDNSFYFLDELFKNELEKGTCEPYNGHIQIVQKYLKLFPHKNNTFVDVGTHFGITIIPYSKLFKKCFGYEANTNNFNICLNNIKLNNIKNCNLKNIAVSDNNYLGQSIQHGPNSGCYYFNFNSDNSYNNNNLIQSIKLDDENISDLDFLKIDVEGAELLVINGAINTINKFKPLIHIESNGFSEKIFNISESQLFNKLHSIGYILFDSTPNNYFFYCPNDSLCLTNHTVFQFWTGNNPLSINRINSIIEFKNNSKTNSILITPYNLNDYILKHYPLHPAFKFLSLTHKADYLRVYFMNFYGGGYSDIKNTLDNWDIHFNNLLNSNNIICGYKEIGPGGVAYPPNRELWESLIGNGCYIMKPFTNFTKLWLDETNKLLDSKLHLFKSPSTIPDDMNENNPNYPIEWNEMLGRIFHRILPQFFELVDQSLPLPILNNYK